jgi:ribonuclease HI
VATDGSWFPHGNREGGWAWAASPQHWHAGAAADTTSGAMEVTATVEALRALNTLPATTARTCRLVSDSQYVVQGCRTWAVKWQERGWKTANRQPVKNRTLWEELLTLSSDLTDKGWTLKHLWVKGHNGHPLNETADRLAREAAQQLAAGTPVNTGSGFTTATPPTLLPWPTHTTTPILGAPTMHLHWSEETHTWTALWEPTNSTTEPSLPLTPDRLYLAMLRLFRANSAMTLRDTINVVVPADGLGYLLPSVSTSHSAFTSQGQALARELVHALTPVTRWHVTSARH